MDAHLSRYLALNSGQIRIAGQQEDEEESRRIPALTLGAGFMRRCTGAPGFGTASGGGVRNGGVRYLARTHRIGGRTARFVRMTPMRLGRSNG